MNDCTAAVILAAGRGSRMRRDDTRARLGAAQREAAESGIKGLIPDTRGRPLLDHIVASLADGGITDVCLVIGPHHDAIRDHYRRYAPQRVNLAFAIQPAPTGTATATLSAEAWVDGRDFLVLNADNLYPVAAIDALARLGMPGLVAFERATLIRESHIDAARIASYAIVDVRADDTLGGIVEKPGPELLSGTSGDWISMNIWRFDPQIFAACRDVSPSPRGELELPHAVGLALKRGLRIRVVRMALGVDDLSHRGDVEQLARRLGQRDVMT